MSPIDESHSASGKAGNESRSAFSAPQSAASPTAENSVEQSVVQATYPQPGISGKWVTSVLVVILATSLLTIGLLLWRYQQVTDARAILTEAWPPFAEALEQRYRGLDRIVADGTDARAIDMRWSERFASARGRFSGSGSMNYRAAAAAELEELLSQDQARQSIEQVLAGRDEAEKIAAGGWQASEEQAAFESARSTLDNLLTGPIGGSIAYLFNIQAPAKIELRP